MNQYLWTSVMDDDRREDEEVVVLFGQWLARLEGAVELCLPIRKTCQNDDEIAEFCTGRCKLDVLRWRVLISEQDSDSLENGSESKTLVHHKKGRNIVEQYQTGH
jgi:hypothetical protein